jgi:type IV pilus assembly protein PilA
MKSLMRMKDDGFTLVELMVVVAIIGVLSAVAIPNFKKYQAKSKTSEAKLQLSAGYTALQSWYSDYDNYATCLNLMGFDPAVERLTRFYAVGFDSGSTSAGNAASILNGAPPACTGAGTSNDTSTASASTANVSSYGAGKLVAGAAVMTGADIDQSGAVAPAATTFTLGAVGVIDASKTAITTADTWTLNENKRLIQTRTGY